MADRVMVEQILEKIAEFPDTEPERWELWAFILNRLAFRAQQRADMMRGGIVVTGPRLKDYTSAIMAVGCDWCGAKPLKRCTDRNGAHTGPHRRRVEKAKNA